MKHVYNFVAYTTVLWRKHVYALLRVN